MTFKSIMGATCACLAVVSFSADAALVSRLGGLAYYDTEADLTWLADANANGGMNWADANAWAAALDVAGVTGWRLPDTNPVNGTAYDYTSAYDGTTDIGFNISAPGTTYAGSTDSEMANMFYNVLGNTAFYDTSGFATGCTAPNYCLTNTGPFSNLQSWGYWSATEYAPITSYAWHFGMIDGGQLKVDNSKNSYAWAVHSGDVSEVVPVPAAVWLFGSGLIGLIGVARRKSHA